MKPEMKPEINPAQATPAAFPARPETSLPKHIPGHSCGRIVGLVHCRRGDHRFVVSVRRSRKMQKAIDRERRLDGYRERQRLEVEALKNAAQNAPQNAPGAVDG